MYTTNEYDEMANYDKIKVLVLGDQDAGKTTLLNHYVSLDWPEHKDGLVAKPTTALDIHIKKMETEGESYIVEFIEFAGDYNHLENYELFLSLYVEETDINSYDTPFHGIVYIFDINSHHSLRHAKKWFNWLHTRIKNLIMGIRSEEGVLLKDQNKKRLYEKFMDIPILFIGNKLDTLYGSTKTVGNIIEENLKQKVELTKHKVKDIIRKNFSFRDVHNLFFTSQLSIKQEMYLLDSFLVQIFAKKKGSHSYNTNRADEGQDFDICEYPLKKFMFLHSIDYIIPQTFLQATFSQLKMLLGYENIN